MPSPFPDRAVRAACLALACLLWTGPARPDANGDANTLFVAAMLAWDQANALPPDAAAERLDLLERVNTNLQAIITDHPSADLAAKLVTGDPLGTLSIPAARDALAIAQTMADRAAAETACLETPDPACLLAQAEQLAKDILDDQTALSLLPVFTRARIEIGDLAQVTAMLPQIQSQTALDYTRLDIMRFQLDAGDLPGAVATADAIVADAPLGSALPSLAKAQFEAGETDAALASLAQLIDIAARETEAGPKATLLAAIAKTQSQAGLFDAAFATADQAVDPANRDRILRQIAEDQASANDIPAADTTTARIADPDHQAAATMAIVKSLAQAGELADARTRADAIIPGDRRLVALAAIANAEIDQGLDPMATLDAAAAVVTSGLPDTASASARAQALNALALAQARAGLSAQAEDTFLATLTATRDMRGLDLRVFYLSYYGTDHARAGFPDRAAQAFAAVREVLAEPDEVSRLLGRYLVLANAETIADMPNVQQTWAEAAALALTEPDPAYRVSSLVSVADAMAAAERLRASAP